MNLHLPDMNLHLYMNVHVQTKVLRHVILSPEHGPCSRG